MCLNYQPYSGGNSILKCFLYMKSLIFTPLIRLNILINIFIQSFFGDQVALLARFRDRPHNKAWLKALVTL